MSRLEKTIIFISFALSIFWFIVLFNFSASVKANYNENTNISYVSGEYWGWNDIVGWINNHDTHTVFLSASKLRGYAGSPMGDIIYDCETSRSGNICSGSNFSVIHDGNGNLEGWAWNDILGWVSFCGGQGTATCPGSINYRVQVDLNTGDFKGDGDDYAWNDVIGWISFNCQNHDGFTCDYSYKTKISASTSSAGILESTPFDTESAQGAQINSVIWKGDLPTGTSVYFQFAASNSSTGPWDFMGTDGTANTYYGPVSPDTSFPVDYSLHNNKRYFKYRVFMYSDSMQLRTPTINDIIINWSP